MIVLLEFFQLFLKAGIIIMLSTKLSFSGIFKSKTS